MVWSMLRSVRSENVSPFSRCCKFSRTRSNTMMVSWTEKPITVSMAVTNRLSTCHPNSSPSRANDPHSTRTSCNRAITAQTPYLRPSLKPPIENRNGQVKDDQNGRGDHGLNRVHGQFPADGSADVGERNVRDSHLPPVRLVQRSDALYKRVEQTDALRLFQALRCHRRQMLELLRRVFGNDHASSL